MNQKQTRVAVVVGTRPEAIKLAPVVLSLRESGTAECLLISTGQHREMLIQALADFGLMADVDLNVMRNNQTLGGLTSRLVSEMDDLLHRLSPEWVLVQGDTTTAFASALCAFYRMIKVGHVEAGLRSGDMYAPFPEEFNRRAIMLAASLHFAPTAVAAKNLLAEGVPEASIEITGNTGIDALLKMAEIISADPPALAQGLETFLQRYPQCYLVTAHRRESFGDGFIGICHAIRQLSDENPHVGCIFPVHLNPRVREVVLPRLAGLRNVFLTQPQDYKTFVYLMKASSFLLTDSGGIQEEAPGLGKPVLVLRDVTERPEGIKAGCAKLVGTSPAAIVAEANKLLTDQTSYQAMVSANNPYGDGDASTRIVRAVLKHSQEFAKQFDIAMGTDKNSKGEGK